MLRSLVLALALANAGYYAWAKGLLAAYGFAPTVQFEPQRLAQQIKPEALLIVAQKESTLAQKTNAAGAAGAPSMSAAAPVPTECLQVGVFSEQQTLVLRERLVNVLPSGSWKLESFQEPGQWLIYMGKYSAPLALSKKQTELRAIGVSFESIDSPALAPGLSLGSFASRVDADTALASIAKKGVKTARVIQERPAVSGQRLTVPVVNADLRTQLDLLKPVLAGKLLKACA